jgi:amino acid adenylation domain-containing protein
MEADESFASVLSKMMNFHLASLEMLQTELVVIKKFMGLPSGSEPFEVLLNYFRKDVAGGSNMQPSWFSIVTGDEYADYPVSFTVVDSVDGLSLYVSYLPSRIKEHLVLELIRTVDLVMSQVCLEDLAVSELLKHNPINAELLLSFGRGEKLDVPYDLAHAPFEKNAMIHPNVVAVEQGENSITYCSLNDRANDLAQVLLENGVQVGDYVAIVTLRSIEMIIGILAVLKTGAAYVPVDATMPKDRISYILETAASPVCLYHPNIDLSILDLVSTQNITAISLHSTNSSMNKLIQKPEVTKDHPAYVIFTSGSTGKPKGVVIKHESLANYVYSDMSFYDLKLGKRMAQLASINFDTSVSEIFCSLSNAATLILRQEDDYFACIRKADTIDITPTGLKKLNPKEFRNLKNVIVGGEGLSESLKNKWANHCNFVNSYGPSEITIVSFAGLQSADVPVNLGRPFPNTRHYVVDKLLNLQPVGVQGELLIAGVGLSSGYLNRPDLTAQKFIHDHFENDGSLMYRTGDICQWTEDGQLQISGRKDDMVKVKGYRIELDEVANAISKHELVRECAAIVRDDMIVAFVTPSTLDTESIRSFIAETMPVYMMPSAYVKMDVLPTNVNGKVKNN